jgi:hypothetical protein
MAFLLMRRYLFQILIIVFLSICYSLSIAPGLTWGNFGADGGDLAAAAAAGGVPHPGGYPLYLIIARGFQLLPIGSLAFRTNLMSAVCTILTVLLLNAYLLRQLPDHPQKKTIAFLSALAFGIAPFVWGQALVTEVYALHGLLLMLCLYVLNRDELKEREWLRGLCFGLAATNHLTAIIMSPLLFLGGDEKLLASPAVLFKRGLGVLSGLSLYISLAVRAFSDPPINWGDASTLNGFFWLISGRIYQQYPFSLPVADLVERVRGFAGLLLSQFTWVGVLLGIYGLISPLPRRVFFPTLWTAATFLFIAIFYGTSDSQVNLLPVWLVFSIWIAFGLRGMCQLFSVQTNLSKSLMGLLLAAMIIRAFFLFPSIDVSKDTRATDFINNALEVIPQNSLVFVTGDEQIFSLWYAQFAMKLRPDMAIVAEGLLPYRWYRENLQYTYTSFKIPQRADLQRSDLTGANPGRSACYVFRDEPIGCVLNR